MINEGEERQKIFLNEPSGIYLFYFRCRTRKRGRVFRTDPPEDATQGQRAAQKKRTALTPRKRASEESLVRERDFSISQRPWPRSPRRREAVIVPPRRKT